MEYEAKCWFLKKHSFFNNLSDSELNDLVAFTKFERCSKSAILYSQNLPIDRIYFLHQGRVKIAYCVDGSVEVVSEILVEGDIFGQLTLIKSNNDCFEFAQMVFDEGVISSVRIEDFDKMLNKYSDLAYNFSKMVAGKLNTISEKYCDLVFKDVRSRVVKFFELHAQHEGKWTGNKAEINMHCTHQDIANFTASSRQTVSTIINNLVKEKKIIYKGRGKLIIPDIQKLLHD